MSVLKDISAAEIRSDLEKPPAFGHFADLTNRRVTEPLDLSGLTLCGFDFSGSRFESDVCFDDATLKGISWFRSTHFEAEADFRSVCFFNDARFDGAGFARNGRFCRAEFRGIATFDACSAQSELDFSDCLANGNFSIAGASLQQKSCPDRCCHDGRILAARHAGWPVHRFGSIHDFRAVVRQRLARSAGGLSNRNSGAWIEQIGARPCGGEAQRAEPALSESSTAAAPSNL
ncbi:MAG: hypothetical protein GY789_17725 [Hyphomicrobiales bacterium]|nr:hypothetical protein [Hyphomicrobiales bacterium]